MSRDKNNCQSCIMLNDVRNLKTEEIRFLDSEEKPTYCRACYLRAIEEIDRLAAENVKLKEQIANRECVADSKGYCGYSQETMNAFIKERDDLTAENRAKDELLKEALPIIYNTYRSDDIGPRSLPSRIEQNLKGESNEQRID